MRGNQGYGRSMPVNVAGHSLLAGPPPMAGYYSVRSNFFGRQHSINISILIDSKHHQCLSYRFSFQYQTTITFSPKLIYSKLIPCHIHSDSDSGTQVRTKRQLNFCRKITHLRDASFKVQYVQRCTIFRMNENSTRLADVLLGATNDPYRIHLQITLAVNKSNQVEH